MATVHNYTNRQNACLINRKKSKRDNVCPSRSQKGENTAFELVLQSAWVLSSPLKQVARHSIPCWKRSQVEVQKVNSGQNICRRDASCGNGKNFENKLSPLRVN